MTNDACPIKTPAKQKANPAASADEFLELYKHLEASIKERFPQVEGSSVPWLSQRREFRKLSAELDYCREVRNLLSHRPRPGRGRDDFAVCPSEPMLDLLRSVIAAVENPPRVTGVMTPKEKLLFAELDHHVRPVMAEMAAKSFTYVPILKKGTVVGVFSASCLISYLAREDIVEIGPTTCFSDLAAYLPLDGHATETFKFVPRTALVSEVGDLFDDAVCSQCRVGVVFVTHNGKSSEKILGMVTAWDVAALA